MKKIIKKFIIPVLLIVSFLTIGVSSNNKIAEASGNAAFNQWHTLHFDSDNTTSSYSVMAFLSSDLFVAEDYSNSVTSVVGGQTYYLTLFLKSKTTLRSVEWAYKLDSNEVQSAEKVIEQTTNETTTNIANITGDTMTGMYYGSAMMTNNISGFGHTSGSNYLEGTASSYLIAAGLAGYVVYTNNIYKTTITTGQPIAAGCYVVGKLKITLNSSANSLSLTNFGNTLFADGYGGNAGYYDAADLNISVGAGQASNDVTTSVSAVNSGTTKTATLTSSAKTASIAFPYTASTTADVTILVDGGNGTATNFTGTVSNPTQNNSKGYDFVVNLPTQRGKYATVTFDVTAQDGTTTESYTLKILREPIITNIEFSNGEDSNGGTLAAPILSTSATDYTTASNIISANTPIDDGTYYVWVSNKLSKFDMKFDADGSSSSSTNGATSGNTKTGVTPSDFTITVKSEDSNNLTYKFVFKTITDNVGLKQPDVMSSGNTSIGTLDSSTTNGSGGTDYVFKIPYQDSNGNAYSTVNIKTEPSDSSKSKVQYWDSTKSSWQDLGTPYNNSGISIDNTTNTGSLKVRVVDKNTQATAEYNITVNREAADTDATLQWVEVLESGQGSNQLTGKWDDTGANKNCGTNDTTFKLDNNVTYNIGALTIKCEASSKNAIVTVDGTQVHNKYYGDASHTIQASNDGNESTITIVVTPQSGQAKTYYIKYTRSKDTRDSDTTLSVFELQDSDGNIIPITNGTFTSGGPGVTLEYEVAYSIGVLTVTATPSKSTSSISSQKKSISAITTTIDVEKINSGGTSTYTYYVHAENGDVSDPAYVIKIKRLPGNKIVGLDTLEVNGIAPYESNSNTGAQFNGGTTTGCTTTYNTSNTLEYYVNLGENNYTITSFGYKEIQNKGIQLTPGGTNSLSPSLKHVLRTIKLVSEDGTVTVTYNIHIYAASTTTSLNSLDVLDNATNSNLTDTSSTQVYPNNASTNGNVTTTIATIPWSQKDVLFNFTLANQNAKVYKGNSQFSNTSITHTAGQTTTSTFYVYSELDLLRNSQENIALPKATADTYEFKITVNKACTETRLESLTSNIGTVKGDPTQTDSIIIENVGTSTTNVTITVKKMTGHENCETVNIHNLTNDQLTYTYSCNVSASTDSFTIKVYGEDTSASATSRVYTVTIYSGSATLETISDLGSVIINSNNVTKYNAIPSAKAEGSAEPVTLDQGVKQALITVNTKSSLARAHMLVKAPNGVYGQDVLDTSDYPSYHLNVAPTTTETYYYLEIYGVAQDTTYESDKYYIKIVVPAVSSDNNLTSTDVNYVNTTPTGVRLKSEIDAVYKDNCDFKVYTSDPKATVTITSATATWTPSNSNPKKGTLSGLVLGENLIIINVTATDGSTPKPYYQYIWVDENPQLDNIQIFQDNTYNKEYTLSPSFNSSTVQYETTVAYTDVSELLRYTLPSGTDTSKLKIQYYTDTNAIRKTFDSANEAIVTLNTNSNSTIVYIEIVQAYTTNCQPASGAELTTSKISYAIEIKKSAAKTDCDLLTVWYDGSPISFTYGTDIEIIVDRSVNIIELTNITHNGKSGKFNTGIQTSAEFSNYLAGNTQSYTNGDAWKFNVPAGSKVVVTYTVKAEAANVSKDYTFVLVSAQKDKEPTGMDLTDNKTTKVTLADVNGDTLNYASTTLNYGLFTYLGSLNMAYLVIDKPIYSTLYIDGSPCGYKSAQYIYTIDLSNTNAPNEITIQVYIENEILKAYPTYSKANDCVSDTYEIKLTRQALDNDPSLNDLVVYLYDSNGTVITTIIPEDSNGTTFVSGDTQGNYLIENIGQYSNVASYKVVATPTKLTTKVNGSSVSQQNPDYTQSASFAINSTTWGTTVTLNTVAEDGQTKGQFTITMYEGAADPDDDSTCAGLQVFDSTMNYYIANVSTGTAIVFDPSVTSYTVNIPYGVQSYTILPTIRSGATGTPYVIDLLGSPISQHLNVPITTFMWGNTYSHDVYVVSKNGTKGTVYTVTVKLDKPDSDNSLNSLTVDGVEQLDPNDPSKITFNLTRDYEVTTTLINASLASSKAYWLDSSILGVSQPLAEGLNTFTLTAVAEDGTSTTYTINITRAQKKPELLDLGVTGENLLDINSGLAVKFDPTVNEYKVILEYSKEFADIYASSNPTDIITGTGKYSIPVNYPKLYTVIVTNVNGVSNTYNLTIIRLPEETTNANLADIFADQLNGDKNSLGELQDKVNGNKLSDDFASDVIYYGVYNVDNKVSSLDIDATPQIAVDGAYYKAATVEVLGADKLHIGNNIISIIVTAPDGETQKAYVIEVEREEIPYDVLEDKITEDGYTLTTTVDNEEYTINIGKTRTSEVDFMSYIEYDENEIEVTYLTNIKCDPDDVILEVKTKDGETKLVTFHVESTGNSHGGSWTDYLPLLIGLLLVIILLTCILIAVNKDKYGKITRKEDKKADKQEKENSKK